MRLKIFMISETKAKRYCKAEISFIENYEQAVNDNTQIWHCHHRRESVYTKKGLIEICEYYDRPAIELIFLTKSEHIRLHMKGKHHSEEHKKKLSESHIGKHYSEKTKKRMSESQMGKRHSEKSKKKMSESKMGNHNAPTKPILQYTKDGEFIREWTSASEASRVLSICQSTITRCCQGIYKSAGCLVWRYK